jgi:hypothetical protein
VHEFRAQTPDEIEVDQLLGARALIKLDALQAMGGPSRPTLHRAFRGGLIQIVKVGKSSAISRATAKEILLRGLPPITFQYGKAGVRQGAKLAAKKDSRVA